LDDRAVLISHSDGEEVGVHGIADAEADVGVIHDRDGKQSIETSVKRDVGFETTIDALGQS
jgi:hypothetical protein